MAFPHENPKCGQNLLHYGSSSRGEWGGGEWVGGEWGEDGRVVP